jgi:hypothetical protein
MSAAGKSYTDAEILAFSRMSYWELDRRGLLTSGGHRASQRIERGPYVARRKPRRDYLSDEEAWRL